MPQLLLDIMSEIELVITMAAMSGIAIFTEGRRRATITASTPEMQQGSDTAPGLTAKGDEQEHPEPEEYESGPRQPRSVNALRR